MRGQMGKMPQKAKDAKGTFRRLMSYLKPFHVQLAVVSLFAALATVFNIVGPRILALVTNELARGGADVLRGLPANLDYAFIVRIIGILLGLYCIGAAFSYAQGFLLSGITAKVSYNLREAIMQKIDRLPLSFFHRVSHGEVLSRITNDVDTLSTSLNQSLTQMITSTATILGVFLMMLSISWKLTMVVLLVLPITALLVTNVMRYSQRYFKEQQKHLGEVNGHIEEMFGGHLVVKAFNGEENAVRIFDERNEQLCRANQRAQFISGLIQPAMVLVGNLGYAVICVLGAAMCASGSLRIGDIQAFIQYVRQFTQPINQIAQISNQFQSALAAAERVFDFLSQPEMVTEPPACKMAECSIRGDVKFDHVRFGYEDTDKIVIRDFCANVRAGQKIALVGPTGAGKTTMVKLLMRFHDLTSGTISVDGHDISKFDRTDLRSAFGMVLQDTWLYNGTILENIRYGRPDATDDEVIAAAKTAQAHGFIRTLPHGYQTVISEEGSNISQGQKQLLTIARAVLADAPILILDEATSSVDTRTEGLIQKAMDHLTHGRTSFIIAHRLSTIRDADLILCIRDGDIVEQGTHEELLAQGGFYAALYNSQFDKVAS